MPGPLYIKPVYICTALAPAFKEFITSLWSKIPPTPIIGIWFWVILNAIENDYRDLSCSGFPDNPPFSDENFDCKYRGLAIEVFVRTTPSIP